MATGFQAPKRIKICGITRADQAIAIIQAGATALGFICVPASPRYIDPAAIAAINTAIDRALNHALNETTNHLHNVENRTIHSVNETSLDLPIQLETHSQIKLHINQPIQRIGVFAKAKLETIYQTVLTAHLTGVQLHGDESPEFCQQVRDRLPQIELIKALRVRTLDDLSPAHLDPFTAIVDTLLLDAYHPDQLGGTGQTLNWATLAKFRPSCPWLLAGGLKPSNVREALTRLHPDGIDLSSGVERSPGDKDLNQIDQLFQALQSS